MIFLLDSSFFSVASSVLRVASVGFLISPRANFDTKDTDNPERKAKALMVITPRPFPPLVMRKRRRLRRFAISRSEEVERLVAFMST